MFLLPVKQVREFAPGLFEVTLERRGYQFVPGECALLFNDGADSRPYSLASSPEEDVLRFLIRRISDGAVSPWLATRKPGDGVRISLPFGEFRPGQAAGEGASAIFVATGVGIAPFLSFARSQTSTAMPPSPLPSPARGEGVGLGTESLSPPTGRLAPSPLAGEGRGEGGGVIMPFCLYGVRRIADAAHLDLLRARTHLRVAVSREKVAGCHHGRVTELLEDIPHDANTHFYLCGLDAMVDDVAAWLQRMGVDGQRVHVEVFFSNKH